MNDAIETASRELCGLWLSSIPDVLSDHTLSGETLATRLPEACDRWVRSLRSLWIYRDTTFCLRLTRCPRNGSIDVAILARPGEQMARSTLQKAMEFTFASAGLIRRADVGRLWIPLLPPEEVGSKSGISSYDEIAAAFDVSLRPVAAEMASIGLSPLVIDDLWHRPDALRQALSRALGNQTARWDKPLKAWIPQPWAGPSGGYLLPFHAISSAEDWLAVSIYVRPSVATSTEEIWLQEITKLTPASPEQRTTPNSGAVSSLAARSLSRVLRHPWLTAVVVSALPASIEDALAVAGTFQGVAQDREVDNDAVERFSYPSARIVLSAPSSADRMHREHNAVEFPRWLDDMDKPEGLRRLDYLTDAQSAATVFRFPFSVRGGVPGVTVEEWPPDFIPGPRHQYPADEAGPHHANPARVNEPEPTVAIGRFREGGELRVPVAEFAKHTLVTGFTGSGKTTTVLSLLQSMWWLSPSQGSRTGLGPNGGGIPFLVLESAKQEYRGLLGISEFREGGMVVYTVGNENCAPLRLNPFVLLPGVRVESHIGRLRSCFEGALPPMPFLPSVLAEALEAVYRQYRWETTDVCSPSENDPRDFPTMRAFYETVLHVVESRGYGRAADDVKAATAGRLKMLLSGSVGATLGDDSGVTKKCLEQIFSRPAVLELNDLNVEDKALVTMFILMFLREHCESPSRSVTNQSAKLKHITVVEEAHNVLGQQQSQGTGEAAGADTRFRSVEAFCNILAEVRALGEGIVISDQSPNKLAPDAMRNTNVQIAHQLRDQRDRSAVASAMIMDDDQERFLGKLKPGHAAVYATGLEKASFVIARNFKGQMDGFDERLTDGDVRKEMDQYVSEYRRPSLPFPGCQGCPDRQACPHREPVLHSMVTSRLVWDRLHAEWQNSKQAREQVKDVSRRSQMLTAAVDSAGIRIMRDLHADCHELHWPRIWCEFLHMISGAPATQVDQRSPKFDSKASKKFAERIRLLVEGKAADYG